jgi:putative Holliday junction resolvase
MVRVMALDVGEKTVGIAVSDPLGLTGQAVETIRRGSNQEFPRLLDLIQEYDVHELLLGLPLRTDGGQGPEVTAVQKFAKQLHQYLLDQGRELPIVFWDERFTTVQAQRLLVAADVRRQERRQVIDQIAAALLLQSYLDRKSNA